MLADGIDEIAIEMDGGQVSASVHGAGFPTVVVLGHGAGSTRRTPGLVALAEALAGSGRTAVLYNFHYSERGSGRPDPPAVLEATTAAVGQFARTGLGAARLGHGGRSMGGRIASQAVAHGASADALVFLGYPLHPPGRFEKLRDRHLPDVPAPMLFVQGTRDEFSRWDLLTAVLARLGDRATLHPVEAADHSFKVLKRSGRTAAEVEAEVHGAVLDWLAAHGL
jgi:predicted alpha/beta-hydrolase family hydrolase